MTKSTNPNDAVEHEAQESENESAQPGDPLRDFNEYERPLLRVRAQRALRELEGTVNDEQSEVNKKEIESAIGHLGRVVECMSGIAVGNWRETWSDVRSRHDRHLTTGP